MTSQQPAIEGSSASPGRHGSTGQLPQTSFSMAFDRVIRAVGRAISWIWVVLLAVVVLNVFMRYALGEGRIEFEEIQWHLYAIGFLVGLSYTFESDGHIRVDLLYERFSLRAKAWIELIGIIVFLVPFLVLVIRFSWPFIVYSISINEVSEAPGGLPARWAIKSFLLIGFLLLAMATASRLTRVTAYLFARPAPKT